MDSLQFSLTPYSFNALALLIIGLAGMLYLLRLREKTSAVYFITIVLAGFTLGMSSWLANGIVLWGGALVPFTDACAVVSMAGVIVFAYHYPQKVVSLEARLARIFAVLVGLVALSISLFYAFLFVVFNHGAALWTPPSVFWMLNPVISLVTLGVCLHRTLVVQSEQQSGGWRSSFSAFSRPQSRAIRLLRNFSFAVSVGMIQGIVSIIDPLIAFPGMLAALLINLSFSLMFVVIVYSVFDLTTEQPHLIIRLVGLSLVTVLGLSGIVGMYTFKMASEWVNAQARIDLALARQALGTGSLVSLPENVAFVIARPSSDGAAPDSVTGSLIYSQSGSDVQLLVRESFSNAAPPVWNYSVNLSGLCMGGHPAVLMRLHYGSHRIGSYYQYAGCLVSEDGVDYEIGFSLAEMNRSIQAKSSWVWGLILGSSLLILGVFPRFFRTNLIRPLDRLLDGVRQADGGSMDSPVPVTYQDEVGFLTTAFNKMTASLKDELAQRQRAEAELRQLNLTLEQRVTDRTRELEALYDVSAAASQAQDSSSLLNVLLDRSLAALDSPSGMILLRDESSPPVCLHLAASYGLPPDWLEYLLTPPVNEPLLAETLNQHDPLLIPNLSRDSRAPDFMRAGEPLTLILAPLSANGQVLGLMGLARNAIQAFDLDDVALLVSIVSQVGAVVHTDHLRQLAQRATVLEERQRLARDLHDSVTQSLYGLATLTEAGKMRLEMGDVPDSTHILSRIGQTARQAIREMRLFLHQLRPPVLEQEGLVNALELRLAAVEGRSDMTTCLEADESIHLSLEVETALYHIAQEALNNTLKHAAAGAVTVRLFRVEQGVALEILDNGRGFNLEQVSSGGMGLDSMRVRAKAIGAAIEIHSTPGTGTCVKVLVEELS